MKWIKLSICLVLLAAVSCIFTPASAAVNIRSASQISDTANIQHTGIDFNTIKDKFLLSPLHNCDPKIFIPGSLNIDPKMLLKAFP